MAAPRIAVVIPALDEEEAIGAVVREIPPVVHEVIVVDNGSRDRTAEAARAAGARVVSEPRRGYGHACLAGIAAAGEADVFVFLDGDHSDYPAQLVDVVAPILEGRADLVIGSRQPRPARGGRPPLARGARHARVRGPHEPAGGIAGHGPRALPRDHGARRCGRLDMRDRNYGWTVEMQVKAARQGLRVVEVPVDYRPRIGRSKVSGTVRGTIGAGTKIIATILRHALARGHGGWARGRPPASCSTGLRRSAWALAGPPPPTRIGPHLGLFGLAFAAYLAALAAARGLSRRGLAGSAWALAVLWRAVLVAAPPLLSNDINRYVWEGRVQVHGGNPYRWSDRPESPRWLPLRDAVYDGLNHKDYTAVYPPLFVLATRGVVAVHDSFTAMKAFLVACELGDARGPGPRPAPPPPAARAPPRARLEPPRPRGDRRQRTQRGLRHAVDGPGPPRPGRRPASPLGPGGERGLPDEVPARPRGRRLGAPLPVVARARRRRRWSRRWSRPTSTPARRRRCC